MKSELKSVALQDVCTLLNGKAYNKPELLSEGKYPVLRVGNFFSNRSWYYSDLELDENKYCDDGDLLYAWSASFGPKIWEGGKVIYHYHIWKVETDDTKIDKKFLYYWFDWDTEKIKSDQGAGTTMIHVTKGSMEKRKLLLPSLPEQKRIVTILDEAFAGIDQAIANTEKNLASARGLFESALNTIFIQGGEDWKKTTLGNLSVVQSGGTPLRSKKEYWEGDIAWYSSGELNQLKTSSPERHISQKGLANSTTKLFPKGSLLIGMYDTAALKMSILDRDGAFNQAIAGVKPNDQIDLQFVLYAINAIKPKILSLRRGVRQKNLNLSKIKNIPISLPNIELQAKVIGSIQTKKREIDLLVDLYKKKIQSLNELKQSLLQKAFSGELTANAKIKAEAAE